MNIENMKQKADEIERKSNVVKSLKDKSKLEFKRFFKVMKESDDLWSKKMASMINSIKQDFKEYFTKQGFIVMEDSTFGICECTEIKATYKDLTFKLSTINNNSESMLFTNSVDIFEHIYVGLSEGIPNYFVWKDNLEIGKIRYIDYVEIEGNEESFTKFISHLDTEEQLNELLDKLEINICHFQEAIEKCDDIKLYLFHQIPIGNKSYKDFKSFIESIE